MINVMKNCERILPHNMI